MTTVSAKYPTYLERHPDLETPPYDVSPDHDHAEGRPMKIHVEHGEGNLSGGRSDDGTIRTSTFNPLSTPKDDVGLKDDGDEDAMNQVPAKKGSL